MNIDLYDCVLLYCLGARTGTPCPREMNAYQVMTIFNHILALLDEQAPTGLTYSRLKKLFKSKLIDHMPGTAPREKHRYILADTGTRAYADFLRSFPLGDIVTSSKTEKVLNMIIIDHNSSLIIDKLNDLQLHLINTSSYSSDSMPKDNIDSDCLLALSNRLLIRREALVKIVTEYKRIFIDAR